uniref:Uncharacterized protein n=1 Tax=Anguilla anguilla TaxID=7936 RepID=A0A0E9RQG5_ANGAN
MQKTDTFHRKHAQLLCCNYFWSNSSEPD